MACRLHIQVMTSPSLGSVTRVKTQEMVLGVPKGELERVGARVDTGKMLQQNCNKRHAGRKHGQQLQYAHLGVPNLVMYSCPPSLLQSMATFLLSSSTVVCSTRLLRRGFLGTALMSRWCLNSISRVEVVGSKTDRGAL
jgi:hypothetical protein